MTSMLSSTTSRSWEYNPGLPAGQQGASNLSCHLCFLELPRAGVLNQEPGPREKIPGNCEGNGGILTVLLKACSWAPCIYWAIINHSATWPFLSPPQKKRTSKHDKDHNETNWKVKKQRIRIQSQAFPILPLVSFVLSQTANSNHGVS